MVAHDKHRFEQAPGLCHWPVFGCKPLCGGAFLRVRPGAQQIRTQNNLLIGNGKFHTPKIRESSGDIRADWRIFAAAVRYDYRLNGEGQQSATVPAVVEAGDLAPHSEYAHPRQIKTLSTAPVFAGAIQTPGQ